MGGEIGRRTGWLAAAVIGVIVVGMRSAIAQPSGENVAPGSAAEEADAGPEAGAAEALPPPLEAPVPPAPVADAGPPAPTPAGYVMASPAIRSPGLVSGGQVLATVGVLGLVTGGVLLSLGLLTRAENECHDPKGGLTFDCEYGNGSDMVPAGIVSLAVGGAALVGGLVMVVVGGKPAKPAAAGAAAARRASDRRRGGILRWSF